MGTRPGTLGGLALLGVVTWRLAVAVSVFICLFISKSWVPPGPLYSHVAGSDLFPGAGHLLEAILRKGRDRVSRTLPGREGFCLSLAFPKFLESTESFKTTSSTSEATSKETDTQSK